MRKILPLAAALASVFAMGAAQADIILVDDFNAPVVRDDFLSNAVGSPVTHCYYKGLAGTCGGGTGQQAVGAGQGAGSVTALSLATQRDVTVALTQNNSQAGDMTAKVGGVTGRLNFQASTGDIGTGQVDWTVPTFVLPPTSASYFFSVIAANSGTNNVPATIGFSFKGTGANTGNNFNVAAQNVGDFLFNPAGSPLNYNIAAADAVKLGNGGILTMLVTGGQGWSILLDQFAFSIPEPTSLALVGLALVGAGLASRRRKV